MSERIKIIGNRRPATGFKQAAAFLDTVVALRGDRPFIPKGYYRFKTFEEAQEWSIRMMARGPEYRRQTTDDGHQTGEERKRDIARKTCEKNAKRE